MIGIYPWRSFPRLRWEEMKPDVSERRPNAPAPRSASSKAAMKDWDRAYEAYPKYAADYAWKSVADVLEAYPGKRVYEVGFGSGTNLQWAHEHGWEVGGCEVAYAALAHGRAALRDADLRKESIVDCTAPSEHYDVVIDRAAMTYLTPKDLKKALFHVRRILRPGGVFSFNPYGTHQTKTFPEHMPPVTLWDVHAARRLFPDTKWELLDFKNLMLTYPSEPDAIENTLQYIVRKVGD
jgi:SAM-dependent methyltransferase